jgi:hypothetical protein
MHWQIENECDEQMLAKLDLGPLAVESAGDETLGHLVQEHNARLTELLDRLRGLKGDRERLADPRHWLDSDGAAIRAAQDRLWHEQWNVLVGVRRALGQREQVLARIVESLKQWRQRLAEDLETAVAKTEKSLAGELREIRRVNPANCGLRFRELVYADANVQAAASALDEAEASVVGTENARYRAQSSDSVVQVRQLEVFQTLAQ